MRGVYRELGVVLDSSVGRGVFGKAVRERFAGNAKKECERD